MKGRHKKESQLLLFPQTDIVFLAGLLRGQPHRVSGRKDVAELIGERTYVPKATTLVGRGGGGRRVDLVTVGVWDGHFYLAREAPCDKEIVLLHRL